VVAVDLKVRPVPCPAGCDGDSVSAPLAWATIASATSAATTATVMVDVLLVRCIADLLTTAGRDRAAIKVVTVLGVAARPRANNFLREISAGDQAPN